MMSLPTKRAAPLWILGCLLIFHFSSIVSQETTTSSHQANPSYLCPPGSEGRVLESTCKTVVYCRDRLLWYYYCDNGQAYNVTANECQPLNNLPECAESLGCNKNDGVDRPACHADP